MKKHRFRAIARAAAPAHHGRPARGTRDVPRRAGELADAPAAGPDR